MASSAVYTARLAEGVCPQCGLAPQGKTTKSCDACRAKRARDSYGTTEAARLAPGPARLLCCGGWRVITGVPFMAPCCGRRYFIETGMDDDC